MLTRRGLFRRALGAIGAATLAGASRWLPGASAPEPDVATVWSRGRTWTWYVETNKPVVLVRDLHTFAVGQGKVAFFGHKCEIPLRAQRLVVTQVDRATRTITLGPPA